MKVRVISAVVALLICIPIIIVGGIPFYLGASIIGLLGFMELLNIKSKKKNIPYVVKVLAVLSFLIIMINNYDVFGEFYIADYQRFTIILFLLLIPTIFFNKSKKYDIEDSLFLLGGILFLGIAFNQLVSIRNTSLNYFMLLILIPILTDTFAYVTGKLVGKHKMSPTVSPNKTWEGFFGGLVLSTFVSTILYVNIFDFSGNLFAVIVSIMFLSFIGEVGDLVESSIKRHFGVKDIGNIMPGHGGVLDRLDSILFVILAFGFVSRFL